MKLIVNKKKLLLYLMPILYCFYGINAYIDLSICLVSFAVFILNMRDDVFYYFYFELLFFENILILPFIGGSLFRIYEVIFFVKMLLFYKNEKKYNISKSLLIPGIILLITSLFYSSMSGFISILINIIIIMIICQNNVERKTDYYYNIFYAVSISIFFGCIYGFFRGNVLPYGSFVRRTLVITDPNYSALFLNIGLFSVLTNRVIKKKIKFVMFSVMLLYLFLTVSISGIICFIITIILYFIFTNNFKNIKYIIAILVVMITFIIVPFSPNSPFYGIQTRISSMIGSDSNTMSSGRTDLVHNYLIYFNNLDVKHKLFGGINIINLEISKNYINNSKLASHNSYIDMLFMVGIIGTLSIIIIILFEIIRLFKIYKNGEMVALNILLIKFVLLFFCMNISIFPFKYFITFYIFNIANIYKNTSMKKI